MSGVTVFLTGLSGAGRLTIADALVGQLEAEGRVATVPDGDVVRTQLSSELTVSKEPYETPARAEVVVDTSVTPLEESVSLIRAAMTA